MEVEASRIVLNRKENSNENSLDEEIAESLGRQLKTEDIPAHMALEAMYEEVQIVFLNAVKKQLNDVKEFRQAILRSRKLHLQSEIDEAERRIKSRGEESKELDVRRLEAMRILSSHGALEQLTRLREEQARHDGNVEALKKKLAMAKRLEPDVTE